MSPTTTKSEYARALDMLTRLLALRDHSLHELNTKMRRRFETQVVEQVLEEATLAGWILPAEQVAARATLAWQRQKKSRRYIETQLRKRRLPLAKIDTDLEQANVRALIERKFGDPLKLNFEQKVKAHRYLKYRGFDARTIRMVFNAEP